MKGEIYLSICLSIYIYLAGLVLHHLQDTRPALPARAAGALSVSISIHPSIWLSIFMVTLYLFLDLHVYLSVYPSICLSRSTLLHHLQVSQPILPARAAGTIYVSTSIYLSMSLSIFPSRRTALPVITAGDLSL